MFDLKSLIPSGCDQITVSELLGIVKSNDLDVGKSNNILSFLAAKSEISGRLFSSYKGNGIKATLELCSPELLLEVASLLRNRLQSSSLSLSMMLKWCNAILKLLDGVGSEYSREANDVRSGTLGVLNDLIKDINPDTRNTESIENFDQPSVCKVIPVTVLFWEGPIARAYLSMLKGYGFKPKKILNLVSSVDLVGKNAKASFLPYFIRKPYCKFSQRAQSHYWSEYIRRNNPDIFQCCKNAAINGFDIPESVYQDAYDNEPLSNYSEDVVDLLVSGLNDPVLIESLAREKGNILFTGGGIVPKSLLDLADVNFLHIHPGKLPQIRGADCTLWSHLVANQPSATLFFMAPGIDDGDVIWGDFLPSCNFKEQTISADDQTLYRSIYAFFDPWVRAAILRKGLHLTNGFSTIESFPQNHEEGVNFHFMHKQLKKIAIDKMFKMSGSND
jgi:hypothetical protein